jgi:hypothetical protein
MNYERNFYKMQGLNFNLATIGTTLVNRFSEKEVTIFGYNELLKICKLFSENTNLVETIPKTLNEKEKYYFYTIREEGIIYSHSALRNIENKQIILIDFDNEYNEINIKSLDNIDWIPAYFIKEFWEIFEDFYGNNGSEDEKNMNEVEAETEMEYNCENTSNIEEICRTIAADLLQNYESYENILASLNGFSGENDDDELDITIIATLFERLFK